MELGFRGIPFRPKQELRVFCQGHELKHKYIPDLVVLDGMIVELKAVSNLTAEHEGQVLNYM